MSEDNLQKPKYLYQRSDGNIFKWEKVKDNIYLSHKNGETIDMEDYIFTGKTSENIVDLIEVGDIITYTSNSKDNINKFVFKILNLEDLKMIKGNIEDSDIATILTHEKYDRECFKV